MQHRPFSVTLAAIEDLNNDLCFSSRFYRGRVELKVYFGKLEPLKSVSKISLCYLQVLNSFATTRPSCMFWKNLEKRETW